MVTVTVLDNQLRTSRDVCTHNLKLRTTYSVKAMSVSTDHGRGKSTELTFQTQ